MWFLVSPSPDKGGLPDVTAALRHFSLGHAQLGAESAKLAFTQKELTTAVAAKNESQSKVGVFRAASVIFLGPRRLMEIIVSFPL